MKLHTKILSGTILTVGAVVSLGLISANATQPQQAARPDAVAQQQVETFQIDRVHSSVIFRIRHGGVTNFYGRFNDFAGTFAIGENGGGHIDVTVKSESVDTGNNGRDNHLRSPDFFTAREHPDITFKSNDIQSSDGKIIANGTLTLHGESREVAVEIQELTFGEFRGRRSGFEAHFTIKRSEFGMDWGIENGALGDEVKLIVSLQGTEPRQRGDG